MKDGFIVTHFDDWDRVDELRALFSSGLGETTREFWLWKYREKNGTRAPQAFIAIDPSGMLVGFMGIQPYHYSNYKETLVFAQVQDMIVAPQYRGNGTIRNMYHFAQDYCKEKGINGYVEFANEASIGPCLKYGAVNMGDIGVLRTTTNELSFLHRPKLHQEKNGVTFDFSDTMPSDIFFTESLSEFKMVKSPEFMQWRFDKNPEESFRWLSVRKDGKMCAWFVFQENRGRFHTAVNIYDYDLLPEFTNEERKQSINVLRTCGSWVSLWGRMGEAERGKWKAAGLTREEAPTSHFLLHFFDGSMPPENWRILRVDRDF